MADDVPSVRDTLDQAYSQLESRPEPSAPKPQREAVAEAREPAPEPARTAEAEATPEPEQADAELHGDRPRDQFGRFTKTRDAEELPAADPAAATDSDQAQPQEPEPETERAKAPPSSPAIAAPEAWSPADKAIFETLPLPAKEIIQRREKQVADGFRQRAEQIDAVQPLMQVLAPYQERLALRGVHPASAVQQLFALQDYMDRDPVGGLAHIARAYGVDLRQYAAAYAQAQKPESPEQQALNQRLAQIESYQQQQHAAALQWQQQQQYAQVNSEVAAFRADATSHPHFELVRPVMAELMQTGRAQTLQDAYDLAVSRSDDVRNAQATARQKLERDAAERARRAAVSVSGHAPRGNGALTSTKPLSRRETIERAYDRAASS